MTCSSLLGYFIVTRSSALRIVSPSLELSGEVGVGVGDLQIVDDLGASIFLDGDNCRLLQFGMADADLSGEIRSSEGRLEAVTPPFVPLR